MEVVKRSGAGQAYDARKITGAMEKAFVSVGQACSREVMDKMLHEVEQNVLANGPCTVEAIQDEVEQVLMANGFYAVAKSYILYRQKRAELRAARTALTDAVDAPGLDECLAEIQQAFEGPEYSLTVLSGKFSSFLKSGMPRQEALGALVKAAVELTTQQAPKWEFIAARLLNYKFELELQAELERRGIHTFYEKLRYLTDEGLYGAYILERYSREELEQAASFLRPERNALFTYAGLDLQLKRYVIHTHQRVPLETPQEMYLGIALHLAMEEKQDRLGWVQRFYDMLSKMEVTMATPTLSNARKPYHQLSSCFIDTVPDSLEGI